jgi:deoxyribodipyrimidine photo-lyase
MAAKFNKSFFIFRRDLRLHDNIGLIAALKQSLSVIPSFIFTPEQIESNPYRSDRCLQFMLESLEDLEGQLEAKKKKLYLFYGEPDEIVGRLIVHFGVDAVFVNRDYTPYSQSRDKKIASVCRRHGAAFLQFDDALLHPPEESVKADGKPYTIFSPYFRNLSKLHVGKPKQNRHENYFCGEIAFAKKRSIFGTILPKRLSVGLAGGRAEGLKILKKIGGFSNYEAIRDFPSKPTTHLSCYLKFNVLSIREVDHAIASKLGPHHALLRSLAWRDFFSSIALFFPHVFKGAFHPKFDRLSWKNDKRAFQKWCEGKTGFPIVDAGMRELNATGFMHNRVRMIAASFLVKDLHIDWRWGEKYFAQKLIDYDPAVNNGNWQWVASTGCDAQPYFRIFNPRSQQEKFDPDGLYIHRWSRPCEPIVDHDRESRAALRYYRSKA